MAIDLFTVGPFTVHGYGLMIGIGFVLAVLIGGYRTKKLGLSEDDFTNISICVLLFGWMGGKIMFIIVNFRQFLISPMSTLGSEGFVVYGGIITGILSIFVYCKIKKLSFLTYMDMMAPAVAINQGLGRVGCFMAGCCYGKPTDSWFGVVFPENSLAPAGIRLIPTQLISALFDILLAVFLILITRKVKYRGMVSGIYLLMYGVGRFIIEIFRDDKDRGMVGILSTSQFISIFMVIFAVCYLYFVNKNQPATEYTLPADDK
ncbi:MAG: prolipoprotein diacylglyceryl transferase [Lachnospiraceae bacterium]|nr:prolipoprotein diacylglyceryl transferase [Lachnospiraceae bacterium]